MSQRYLAPTSLFFHWRDPLPPEFPEPRTGDIYLNISYPPAIRVYLDGEWRNIAFVQT